MRMTRCDAKRCWSRCHRWYRSGCDYGTNGNYSKIGASKAYICYGDNGRYSTNGMRKAPSREGGKDTCVRMQPRVRNPI